MPDSPYTDLERPPLSQAALTRALVHEGGLWTRLSVVDRAGSTNADLAGQAREGAPEGAVLIAEHQVAGRGRLDRTWTSPARSGLTFSVLLRPRVPPARQGWLTLMFALAAATAVRRLAEVDVRLKWPNDLMIGERKLAGILAERVDGGVVIGMGLNVSLRAEELPVPTATSLVIEKAACTDRDPLIRAILREVESHYRDWAAAEGDADASGLRTAYAAASATIGKEVRVELPGDQVLRGVATGVDAAGFLIVHAGGTDHALSVGDIVHLRPAEG
ncbi:biotin--[acetyl-CoA-carboxylase] ligase [Sphaerisporangium melleum]|uniref:biotin--[biotin carboxyl-carrier protein] ligase n=1 Tax=Sphaerisporangium melleum TaxID=321316 RepID=A0A917QS39_9ACTN|nr:biotin--[acetyl-CoA-carboxylase] ligase [Sphaerisporangium melleum]GGK65651.1 biotin--[acetyl-CoA-carboxylase] ligase [Sphaerisporangium melleum]GII69934.1 biotin--[acetyl-CoA-carboxylase] ligase [Sphaerisporangium melleum]